MDIDKGKYISNISYKIGMDDKMLRVFPIAKFKVSPNMNEEQKRCTVCFTEFEPNEDVKFLFCMHIFHQECIDPWLKENSTCPICKKD